MTNLTINTIICGFISVISGLLVAAFNSGGYNGEQFAKNVAAGLITGILTTTCSINYIPHRKAFMFREKFSVADYLQPY